MKTSIVALRRTVILLICAQVGAAWAQDAPPAFSADVYVVSTNLLLIRGRCALAFRPADPQQGKPIEGLKADAFRVEIDKGISVPVTVVPEPDTPGGYVVTFSPPDALRDGKKHRVVISIPGYPPCSNGRAWTPKREQELKFDKAPRSSSTPN